MHHLHDRPAAISPDSRLRAGALITNARGTPGTLGCLAVTLDDRRLVFLTSHHVVFGAGAREQEPVFVAVDGASPSLQRIARARHGRRGTVSHHGAEVHIDCATIELDEQTAPVGWRLVEEDLDQEPALLPGARVTKAGATTGTTHGFVEHTNFSESARIGGRSRETPGQILVRPCTPGEVFTARGDSGAVLRNEDGAVVGLLWGADARGYGLACPIAPVLRVLHVGLARFEPTGVS